MGMHKLLKRRLEDTNFSDEFCNYACGNLKKFRCKEAYRDMVSVGLGINLFNLLPF